LSLNSSGIFALSAVCFGAKNGLNIYFYRSGHTQLHPHPLPCNCAGHLYHSGAGVHVGVFHHMTSTSILSIYEAVLIELNINLYCHDVVCYKKKNMNFKGRAVQAIRSAAVQ
jgi:hypothetical protein